MPREPELRDFLQRALSMTKAARNQARAALSENLTRFNWRPGQPLADPIRKLRQADVDLEKAEEILQGLLQREREGA